MNLYDSLIQEALDLVSKASLCLLPLAGNGPLWPAEDEQRLIFQRDMAYELGEEVFLLSAHWPTPPSLRSATSCCSVVLICLN